jgi:hypothetical protein
VFVARGPAGRAPGHELCLVRGVRRGFSGAAEFLADPQNRARVGEYLADMGRPYGCELTPSLLSDPPSPALGQSYGEMAAALIPLAVPAGEPVDLLVLAFSVHDLRPGRQTAAYLSHVTPGEPMAFAICDQGSAAAFSGLRIARAYASSAGIRRALLIVVEQAALPYRSAAALPAEHRAVAMLYGDCATAKARIAGVRQHPGVPAERAAGLAAADLAELAAGHRQVGLVLSDALAALWTEPEADRVRAMAPGQPSTGVWWGLTGELSDDAELSDAEPPDLLVAADYDPDLRYLSLAAFDAGPPSG